MRLPTPKRRLGNLSALVVAGLAMTGFESWSHLAGLIIGCGVVVFALVMLFIPEPPSPEPPVQRVIHENKRTWQNPNGW
jgi:hypothetical protein